MQASEAEILTGALTGNALGAPVNALRHGHIQQLVGGQLEGFVAPNAVLFPDKPARNRLRGLHDAVGQRLVASLAVARPDDSGRDPVARAGALMLELAGETQVDGESLGVWRAPGRPLRRALTRWREAWPWDAADFQTPDDESEGISAAVCGLVPAIMTVDQPEDICLSLARLTHLKPLALESALAVHHTVRLIGEQEGGRKFKGVTVARGLIELLKPVENRLEELYRRDWRELGWGAPVAWLSQILSPLPSLLEAENDDLAVRTIVATAMEAEPRHAVTHPQHGFAGAALPWILYRVLGGMAARRAMEDILNRGGETSVIGCLAGGLLAARFGEEFLAEEWLESTRGLQIVRGLITGNRESAWNEWLAAEQSWSTEEKALHDKLAGELDRERARLAAKGKLPAPKRKSSAVEEETELPFAPPPSMWLKPGDEEDPRVKKILRAARGKKKIDWKEERRRKQQQGGEE